MNRTLLIDEQIHNELVRIGIFSLRYREGIGLTHTASRQRDYESTRNPQFALAALKAIPNRASHHEVLCTLRGFESAWQTAKRLA